MWIFKTSVFHFAFFFCLSRCGDVIVSVNEHGLEKVTHAVAVEILKQVDGAVMLTVTSWPGTVV